ncbi:hypothetical protein DCAR_0310163 [Daucus carota subsp. sativus]|uniref:Uncharacterized protein n=1 Tax=Daucus carota subsp. sativus TaxID=79200 RepID=A0A165ZMX3_DAUCS|nr:hypothetical protein DCAR_0310163 [Daucus carota subsp. sativus]
MLMSMLSSFDALFAESFGHKVGFSWPLLSAKDVQPSENKMQSSSGNFADKFIAKKLPENQEVQQKTRKIASTRFAPELDGVHFFETIIPY